MLIDVEKSKKYFYKKLKSYLSLNNEINKIRKVEKKFIIDNDAFDYVFNCTYYQKFVQDPVGVFYEVTTSLIYKCSKNFPALTFGWAFFYNLSSQKKLF